METSESRSEASSPGSEASESRIGDFQSRVRGSTPGSHASKLRFEAIVGFRGGTSPGVSRRHDEASMLVSDHLRRRCRWRCSSDKCPNARESCAAAGSRHPNCSSRRHDSTSPCRRGLRPRAPRMYGERTGGAAFAVVRVRPGRRGRRVRQPIDRVLLRKRREPGPDRLVPRVQRRDALRRRAAPLLLHSVHVIELRAGLERPGVRGTFVRFLLHGTRHPDGRGYVAQLQCADAGGQR